MVLILFLLTAYVINKYLSPKIVKTKKDNAKLWLVRFTALYMLPVISQFFNPTIPIVKEIGILGLLAPYIFVAIIVYGLGYFFAQVNIKNKKNIKIINVKNNNIYILVGIVILLVTYILFDKNEHKIVNTFASKQDVKECELYWDGFKFKLGKADKSKYSSYNISYYGHSQVNFYIPKDMLKELDMENFKEDDKLENHTKFAEFLNKELFPIAPTLCSLSR
jgi:hypothetical protein